VGIHHQQSMLSAETVIPKPCEVDYAVFVPDPQKVEQHVHTRMKDLRPNRNREWFETCPNTAAKLIRDELNKLDIPIIEFGKFVKFVDRVEYERAIEGWGEAKDALEIARDQIRELQESKTNLERQCAILFDKRNQISRLEMGNERLLSQTLEQRKKISGFKKELEQQKTKIQRLSSTRTFLICVLLVCAGAAVARIAFHVFVFE